MVFKTLEDEKKIKRAKDMRSHSEMSHEQEAKKGKVDKRG